VGYTQKAFQGGKKWCRKTTKGMKQQGWYWIDKNGKKWTKDFDGSLAEVNPNKTYT